MAGSFVEGFAQRKVDGLDGDLVRLDLRQIEDVVDDAQQVPRRAADLGDAVELPWLPDFPVEQVRQPDDGVHRGADFVAHVGQEGALGAVGAFSLVAGRGQLEGALLDKLGKVVAVLRQFAVELLAFGDVADKAHGVDSAAPFEAARLDLGRVAAAVLAPMDGFELIAVRPAQHGQQLVLGEARFPVPDMEPGHLVGCVAQHRRQLRVGLGDAAVLGEDNDAVTVHFKLCAPARGLFLDQFLGLQPGKLLGAQGVEEFIEMPGELGDLVGFAVESCAGLAVAQVDGGHGLGHVGQPARDVSRPAQEGQRQRQHGEGQQGADAAGQQPFFLPEALFREARVQHADPRALAVHEGGVAGDLPAVLDIGAFGPRNALVEHLLAHLRAGVGANGALVVLPGYRRGDAYIVQQDRRGSAALCEIGVERKDHIADAVDHRQVVVEQHSADEDCVRVDVGDREMGRSIDQQAARLGVRAVGAVLIEPDQRPFGQPGRQGRQFVGIEAGIFDGCHAGVGLLVGEAGRQLAAGGEAGAGGDDLPVLGGDDQEVEAGRVGAGSQHLVEGGLGMLCRLWAVGGELPGQAFRADDFFDGLLGLGAQLLHVVVGAGEVAACVGLEQGVETLAAEVHQDAEDERKGDEQRRQAQCHQPQVKGGAPATWTKERHEADVHGESPRRVVWPLRVRLPALSGAWATCGNDSPKIAILIVSLRNENNSGLRRSLIFLTPHARSPGFGAGLKVARFLAVNPRVAPVLD